MHREVGRAKDLLARRYVSKDVRILGSKPKRARQQKSVGNTAIQHHQLVFLIAAHCVLCDVRNVPLHAQVKLSLFMSWRHNRQWSASSPGHFTPGKKATTHRTGGWVVPIVSLGVSKNK